MSAVIIPPDILPESPETIELVDDQTMVFEPQFSRRYVQRNSYSDPRWRIRRRYRAMRSSDRSRLLSALSEARGAYRVVYVSPAQSILGSWPGTELFTNADFSQGTSGWTSSDSGVVSAYSGRLRMTRRKGGSAYVEVLRPASLSPQYAPFALRALYDATRWLPDNEIGPFISDSVIGNSDYSTDRGMRIVSRVSLGTASASNYPGVAWNLNIAPGSHYDLLFTSLARCMIADGGPNWVLHSNDTSNVVWNNYKVTISSITFTAPDNSSTANTLVPNTDNDAHYISQRITVDPATLEYTICGAFKSAGYGYVRLQMGHNIDSVLQMFDLNNGTLATTSYLGSGWTNPRAYISALGDGWYYCSLTARKTTTDLFVDCYYVPEAADTTAAYTGTGASGIYVWRLSAAQSSLPMRLVSTTTNLDPGSAQSSGGVHVRGLPASTDGLLLPGDWVEINNQLKQVTAALNSDAAGLGYLQFRPALHRPVTDNTPIIVTKPMGRFLLRDGVQWDNRYGHYADIDLTLDEVYE